MSELLIGCGPDRTKKMGREGMLEWTDLVTLDINSDHNPDVVWDLNDLPLPFLDNTFDEIHAYECLEHCGRQGDFRFFFDQFSDFWRMLKPGGFVFAIVPDPNSESAWADPGHCRIFTKHVLLFLEQTTYTGVNPRMLVECGAQLTDYRFCYKADFLIREATYWDGAFKFVLQSKKEG